MSWAHSGGRRTGSRATARAASNPVWLLEVPGEHTPETEEYGDRRQEVEIIGQDVDRKTLTARLDACLLDDVEMAEGPTAWAAWVDPLRG